MAEEKVEFRRLDTDIVPNLYKLHLAIDFERSIYTGDLTVDCDVKTAVNVLTINSLELSFPSAASFVNESGETIAESTDTVTNDDAQTVTFNFGSEIPIGKHSLRVKYAGELKRALCGLYKSTYKSAVDGTEKVIATTQFEPTDARRMLPCWDEPAIKARFHLSVTVPGGDTKAISNMPIVEQRTLKNNKQFVEFDTSPVMSTYLLALVVGEFDYVSTWFENIEIRTYTSVGNSQKGLFSLDVAKRALEFFHKYFEIPYALPKVDLIAIPDFAMGAMENWGLITYRESRLLCDPESESQAGRIDKGKVVCHELTHMWFGNLVTMEWWTHLWLNEGFARFLENTCLSHLFPEYRIMDAFVADVTFMVLNLDALLSSHPIEVPVKHPKEINEIFDAISYAKGGSVLRMLNNFLTPEVFRQGISHYLKRFSYKNTQTEDLWNALSEVSNKDVEGFMRNWTGKMGYPVVKVEQVQADGASGMTLKFTQSRFLASGEKSPEDTIWSINVVLQSADGEERFQLDKESDTFTVSSWNSDSWVKVNAGQFGYFRVDYADELSKRLTAPIASKTLSAVDRLGVINDSFAMAQAGRASVTQFLDLLTAYEHEDDAIVVAAIASHLSALKKLHGSEDYSKILGDVINHTFDALYRKLGWEHAANEEAQVSKLRTTVLSAMSQHPEVIAEAKRRFAAYVEDSETNKIVGDQRTLIYSVAVQHDDGASAYDAVLDLYNKSDLQQEQQRCMIALSKPTDPKLVARTLEWNLTDVRPNTAYWPIISAARTPYNYKQAWGFFKENFQRFYEKFPAGMKQVLGAVIYSFAGSFASTEYHDDVRDFFAKNPCPEAASKIRQSLEAITVNTKRFQRQTADLSQWLAKWKESRQA